MGFIRCGKVVQGGYRCIKYTLVVFNILVILCGSVVIALGILMVTKDYGTSDVSDVTGIDYMKVAHFLIGLGTATIVIALFGCAGAAFENKYFLAFYFAIMLILVICFLAVIIVSFAFKDKLADTAGKLVHKQLMEKYGTDKHFTKAWDEVQRKLECCGLKGDVYSNTSWAFYRKTTWYTDQQGANRLVPESCCKKGSDIAKCRDTQSLIPVQELPVTKGTAANDLLFKDGCLEKLTDPLGTYAAHSIGITIATLLVTIVATLYSCCLCMAINRGESYVV
ncbi:leukocyte surface antigen CD53-like isoform X1 [Littorina saxatilis]|uniref:Tetraspanin n=1 Tax=Littorina saxatilis TaxID=31220 RepID=A0AAN9GB87_9CAEN